MARCVVILLLFAAPVSAQSLTLPTAVFSATAAADWTSTYVSNTRWSLHESNPLIRGLQSHPALMVAAGAAIDVAGVTAWNHLLGHRHPHLAAAGLYVAAGFRVYLTAHNITRGLAERDRLRVPFHLTGGR